MIFIVAKFPVRPESADTWLDTVRDFTESTRAEPGNLWFDWSRSVDDPNEFVLVEAFADGDAGGAHVNSEHFKTAMAELGQHLSARPSIINFEVDGTEWSSLGEVEMP